MVIQVFLLAILVFPTSMLLTSLVAVPHDRSRNATPSVLTDRSVVGYHWSSDTQLTHADRSAPVYAQHGLPELRSSAMGSFTTFEVVPRTIVFRCDTYRLSNIGDVEGVFHSLFAAKDVKALATGWTSRDVRIELSPWLTGWVPRSRVRLLPPGTPPPRAVLGTIWTYGGSQFSRLGVALSEAVPSRIEIVADRIRLVLYYTEVHTSTMVYGPDNPMIREVRWSQEADGLAHVDVWLTPEAVLWGYTLAYEPEALTLELRWPSPTSPEEGRAGDPDLNRR